MLIIRKEQMDFFRQNTLGRFFDDMKQHLKKRYQEKTAKMEDGQLHTIIVEGVHTAKGYDITDENDVKRFLEYLVEYGHGFGETPDTTWAGQLLNDKKLSDTEKMDKIDDYDLFVITLGES